jgi:hypothetical protein
MARLYLFAEGETEAEFAKRVLANHLAQFGVHRTSVLLVSHGRRSGKAHRGGGRNYLPMKKDIERLLQQEKGNDVFFTTMIDLYAIPASFPGLKEASKLRHPATARVMFLEAAFAKDVDDSRFIPHIQLHEFEAYLFCKPSEFSVFFEKHEKQIQALQKIADDHSTPEMIDDGLQTAPSKRIIHEIPEYESLKSVAGPQIAERIGLAVIRAKCPHFDRWLSRLESLAS